MIIPSLDKDDAHELYVDDRFEDPKEEHHEESGLEEAVAAAESQGPVIEGDLNEC